MLSFHEIVKSDFQSVNSLIIEQLHSDVGLVENIGHYIVDAGGKRLRPLLVLLVANCLQNKHEDSISLAAIIEFIHTATLLHDDVVDVSNQRRGRPTANAKWGNAPSVLVGDFLYSRAFQMMVAINDMDIMSILSNTTNIISEGEVQQLVNAKDPNVDEGQYMTVIHKKTAALFEAACETAAVLSVSSHTKSSQEIRQASKQFGYHLGMAFQLIDDALDYKGDAENLGKNIGDDLAEGKLTLPVIAAREKAQEHNAQQDVALIKTAIQEADIKHLDDIVRIVKKYEGLEYTEQCAKQHVIAAQECLSILPDNAYRSAMSDLAEFAISRNH